MLHPAPMSPHALCFLSSTRNHGPLRGGDMRHEGAGTSRPFGARFLQCSPCPAALCDLLHDALHRFVEACNLVILHCLRDGVDGLADNLFHHANNVLLHLHKCLRTCGAGNERGVAFWYCLRAQIMHGLQSTHTHKGAAEADTFSRS